MILSKLTLICSLSLLAVPGAILGTPGNDFLQGTADDDVINALGGDDVVLAGAGDDIVNGGPGNDFALGDEGDDRLFGGEGDDGLRGWLGNDLMVGGTGDDRIDLWAGLVVNTVPPVIGLDEYDIGIGGEGDDHFAWASGKVTSLVFPPFIPVFLLGGSGEIDGGPGFDTLEVGVGIFSTSADDYVIEPATKPGFTHQIRSVLTGKTVQMRGIERVTFVDQTVDL